MGLNKIVFTKQHDSMQCGIACLAMVCSYYNKEYSIEFLSRYCFATTEGVSLQGISETANKLGLRTQCGRLSMNQLKTADLPCILHWNQNHFVVLYRVKSAKKFYVADPGKGLMKYDEEDFEKHWISTQSPCFLNLHRNFIGMLWKRQKKGVHFISFWGIFWNIGDISSKYFSVCF